MFFIMLQSAVGSTKVLTQAEPQRLQSQSFNIMFFNHHTNKKDVFNQLKKEEKSSYPYRTELLVVLNKIFWSPVYANW